MRRYARNWRKVGTRKKFSNNHEQNQKSHGRTKCGQRNEPIGCSRLQEQHLGCKS